jgi:putative sigma-54 modulation protein
MAKPNTPAQGGYNIIVVCKHFQITDAIRNYVLEKFGKVEKITDQIIDMTATLNVERFEYSCHLSMSFSHFKVNVVAKTEDIYSAIDKCSNKLMLLIRKYKSKLQSHRAKDLTTVDIHVNVIAPLSDEVAIVNDEITAETVRREQQKLTLHPVVASDKIRMKTLTQDEAVMKMEVSGDQFLIYRSEEDQKIKVLYRRKDENYGLVEVQ